MKPTNNTKREKQLPQNINLVKWEQSKKLQKFSLLTIHSLLLNANPRFIEMKKIIEDFNNKVDKGIDRKHLQEEFVRKLYSMLSQMILIPNYQNQVKFMQRVWQWVNRGGVGELIEYDFIGDGSDSKSMIGGRSRPTTASTRTRPFSAYSRPKSGVRPSINSGHNRDQNQLIATDTQNKKVDYSKLKPGQVQFYNGMRTLHPEDQAPKKLLRMYQRKVFYDQQVDSDAEIDLDPHSSGRNFFNAHYGSNAKKQQTSKMIQAAQAQAELKAAQQQGQQQKTQQQGIGIQNQQQNQQNQQQNPAQADIDNFGLDQGAQIAQQEDLNNVDIDDLGLDEGAKPYTQEDQVPDKLRPKLKSFINYQTGLSRNKISYNRGVKDVFVDRNNCVRKKEEDHFMREKMAVWAKNKSRIKQEQKRRAESARMITNRVGIGYGPSRQAAQSNHGENLQPNVIDFQNINITQIQPIMRPKTAFKSTSVRNRQQLIQKCFMNQKLGGHITKFQTLDSANIVINSQQQSRCLRINSCAQKPKKKTFQDILRQAQNKMKQQQFDQVMHVKDRFAKSKLPFDANKIAKSVTYHALTQKQRVKDGQNEREQDDFKGLITGMNMMNNPFFKVGKKKKKKKTKKR